MHKNFSPEERLLSLIKGKHRKPREGPEAGASSRREEAPAPPRPAAAENPYIKEFLRRYVPKNRFFDPVFLASFNKVLIVILAALALYVITETVFVRPYRNITLLVSAPREAQAPVPRAVPAEASSGAAAKGYSQYSQAIAGKKIFGTSAGLDDPASQLVSVSGDLASDVGLVGILAGDKPQAIIEDKKSQKVYYLGVGESFDGFTIAEISEGKVTIERGGQRSALFL